MEKIRIGVCGYGNLGKGVILALKKAQDMELVAVFSRRDPNSLALSNILVESIDNINNYRDKIDVMILCGGSATDLPAQSVEIIKNFNTVDSFDTHAKIPEYFDNLNREGKLSGKLGLISVGWDPGLFSIARTMFESVLPGGETYTFWGKGVSQGHSDAIRRIKGVIDAKQYTIPKDEAIEGVRSGKAPNLSPRDKHLRECFVVADINADKAEIEREIKEMPNYFADYDTIVHFISKKELVENHSKMAHGGFVLRSGESANQNKSILEFSLKLDSNPEFTSSVLVSYSRAVYKLAKENRVGAITVLDIAPKYLSCLSEEELRKKI